MKLVLIALLAIILVSSTVSHAFVEGKSKDSKARDAIVKAMGKAVEGKYSQIDIVSLSKFGDNQSLTFYNKTVQPLPPPVPPPIPTPTPTPTGPTTKVCLVGDLKGSTVPSLLEKGDCNYKIGLGDLGYGSDLSYFKSLHFDRAVCGNHDTKEDGNSNIEKECLAYTGDHWILKIGTTAIMIGVNTNGDPAAQLTAVKQALQSQVGHVNTLIVVSHKNGHVFPNAHHPAEASSLYKQIEALIPQGVTLYEISGHNHNSAAAVSKHWYIAGAGGKSFYSCGTDAIWTYCDNKSEQYLELTIDNLNGNTVANFRH